MWNAQPRGRAGGRNAPAGYQKCMKQAPRHIGCCGREWPTEAAVKTNPCLAAGMCTCVPPAKTAVGLLIADKIQVVIRTL